MTPVRVLETVHAPTRSSRSHLFFGWPATSLFILLHFVGAWFEPAEAAEPEDAGVLVPVRITAVEPEANYPETRDSGDLAQLADGYVNRFPFWTSRASVGWVKRTPVSVVVTGRFQEGVAHRVLIRTAMQAMADVYPPRRIDVYCLPRSGEVWRHSGSLTYQKEPKDDGGPINLSVPFATCGGTKLKLVLHSGGPYLMIDEVSVMRTGAASTGSPVAAAENRPGAAVAAPTADSLRRLEASLREVALSTLKDSIGRQGVNRSLAWLSEPWGALSGPVRVASTDRRLSLTVLPQAEISYVIGLANSHSGRHRYMLQFDPTIAASTSISKLVPVLAADGRLVFDAIDERQQATFEVSGESIQYLLIREQPVVRSGIREIKVSDDSGWQQVLSLEIEMLDRIRSESRDHPRVIVWTYTNDEPIWSAVNAGEIASRLADAGVNVFDIHPAHIPLPLDELTWPARLKALKSDLAIFKGKGLILLFLGNTAWEQLAKLPDSADARRRLTQWVALLRATLKESGYADKDWALYPIDEPHGDDLGRLADVIVKLRNVDPTLHFYANPTVARGKGILSVPALWKLRGLIDYWQPMSGEAFETVKGVIGSPREAALWLYENPVEPARSTSPACYRRFATAAFNAGARGFGFWSFSNTSGSSAWSDFDGQQPDWAVVYEASSSAGFVSSRRWEGFKQGIRDFAALSYCARQTGDVPLLKSQCATLRSSIHSDLERNCAR